MAVPPLRLRWNSDILTNLFHRGDQRMIQAFKDIEMHDIMPKDFVEPEDEASRPPGLVQDLAIYFDLQEGFDKENYDFQLSLNDPELGFLGF